MDGTARAEPCGACLANHEAPIGDHAALPLSDDVRMQQPPRIVVHAAKPNVIETAADKPPQRSLRTSRILWSTSVLWSVWSGRHKQYKSHRRRTPKQTAPIHRKRCAGGRAGGKGGPAGERYGRASVGVRMGMCRGWGYAFEALGLCFCRRN